ncbi:hypothetical protein GCK72_008046 [Caenorhabditis remanei]|uniref:Uncharacterized protein n=1 Tax=Caenorhabditis remanei TaxID=31234 RepID=A0A6A5HKM8_CAERE|nr:hypothetical protein GCK72_008046 [Caenorhabditis remanei]KAF1768085.1 hypothetical protein GCK72_008046 [Caenorhabditis remanei]
MSAQRNKPHKFIIWQTLAVCIGKIFYLEPMYLHYVRHLTEKDYHSLLADIDLMLIPLIIQVVYLGSTKQNLDLLSVKVKNLFRRKSNQIQPYIHIHEILTGLLTVSVLFYIPIFVSVRKMGHLMSVRMSRPQMFIFWQSLAVCIGKILYLCPAYFYYFTKETNELNYLAELARLDIVMIQLLNQMTYIGCNRQNLQFLYRIVKKCLMKLFCKGSSVQIQPYVINNDGGMETTQQSSPLN